MNWICLILAGLFEVGFAISLKFSENFTRLMPSLSFFIFGGISFFLLTRAMQTIPIGTAYAVWTGIGAAGTMIMGIFFFKDPVSAWRIFFLTLLVGSVIGLKVVSAPHS